MLRFFVLLCFTLVTAKLNKEVDSDEKYTKKVRPEYLKRFEHGYTFCPEVTAKKIEKKKNGTTPTTTTVYTEPEFKRFCNECEDYWHPNCFHYPHIYDDLKGCVIRTLSPKSAAQMEKGSDEEDEDSEEEEEEEEYEEEMQDDASEGDHEAGGETKKPEVLMKAADFEAMRERFNLQTENGTDQGERDAVIAKVMQEQFHKNNTGLREEEIEAILKHAIPRNLTSVTEAIPDLETVAFSVEQGRRVTIYKDLLDDANAQLDMRINNAQASCPRELSISQSIIPENALGIWTKVDLPKGVVMGPYRGALQADISLESTGNKDKKAIEEHVLPIYHPKTRQLQLLIDGRSNTLGNWCRYINGARHLSEQNLEIFFSGEHPLPFFRTIKEIQRNTELLADFGPEYRKDKYVSLVNVIYTQPLMEPLPRRKFPCSRCNEDQGSPLSIQKHRKLCNATRQKKTPRPKKIKHILAMENADDEEITPGEQTPGTQGEETTTSKKTPAYRHTRPRGNRPNKKKRF